MSKILKTAKNAGLFVFLLIMIPIMMFALSVGKILKMFTNAGGHSKSVSDGVFKLPVDKAKADVAASCGDCGDSDCFTSCGTDCISDCH